MAFWFIQLAAIFFFFSTAFASPYNQPNPTSTCGKPSTITLTTKKTCTVYVPTTKYKEKTRYSTIRVPKTITKWKTSTITITSSSTQTKTVPSLCSTGTVTSTVVSVTTEPASTVTETSVTVTTEPASTVTETSVTVTTEPASTVTETSVTVTTEPASTVTETSVTITTEPASTVTETSVTITTETSVTTSVTTEVSITTETSISTEVSSTTTTETYTPTCNSLTTPYLSDNSFATSTQAGGFYSFWTVAKATLAAPNSFQTGAPSSNNVYQYVGTHPSGYGANLDFTSLQVVVFGNQIVKVSQMITLCAGQTYRLKGYWNYAGGSDACSAEICFDGQSCGSGGRYTSASNFPGMPTTDRYGWLPYFSTFTPTVSGEVEVQFKFKCEGTAVVNGNRLYLDHTTFSIV